MVAPHAPKRQVDGRIERLPSAKRLLDHLRGKPVDVVAENVVIGEFEFSPPVVNQLGCGSNVLGHLRWLIEVAQEVTVGLCHPADKVQGP